MRPMTDDYYLPISALNDLLFCERRCALHRIEQVWVLDEVTPSTGKPDAGDPPVRFGGRGGPKSIGPPCPYHL